MMFSCKNGIEQFYTSSFNSSYFLHSRYPVTCMYMSIFSLKKFAEFLFNFGFFKFIVIHKAGILTYIRSWLVIKIISKSASESKFSEENKSEERISKGFSNFLIITSLLTETVWVLHVRRYFL